MESKLTSRSEPTPNTETEIKVPQEDTAPVAATTAEKGKAPVDKTAIEENANNLIAKGGKSMALKAWEEAVSYFGEALENMYVALLNCLWQCLRGANVRYRSRPGERSTTNSTLVWHLFYLVMERHYSSLGSVNRE
jgi:hypothetical protein